MARSLTKLNFNRVSHAVSGFLTVIVMPLTYSIAYGLIAGIGTYMVMEGVFWILSFVGLERPVDEKEASKLVIGKSFRQLTEPKDKTEEAVEPKPEGPVEEAHTSDNIDESGDFNEVVDVEAGK